MHTQVPSTVYTHLVSVSVYLPPCYQSAAKQLPVIYLLHGGNADETQWIDLQIQPVADSLIANGAPPFVVVLPGGDYQAEIDYGAFVLNDLLPAMSQQFNLRTDAAGRAIGGISLGGYWALDIAFHHPDQFAAVGGYSPVVVSSSGDLVALARVAAGLDQLRIQLDVGEADALVADTGRLAATLVARGLNVSSTVNSGGHNRPYWRSHTRDYVRFMLAANFTSSTPPHRCLSESQAAAASP